VVKGLEGRHRLAVAYQGAGKGQKANRRCARARCRFPDRVRPGHQHTSVEAIAGKPVQLTYHASARKDCTPAPPQTIRVIQAPKAGALTIRPGKLRAVQKSKCLPRWCSIRRTRCYAGPDHVGYRTTRSATLVKTAPAPSPPASEKGTPSASEAATRDDLVGVVSTAPGRPDPGMAEQPRDRHAPIRRSRISARACRRRLRSQRESSEASVCPAERRGGFVAGAVGFALKRISGFSRCAPCDHAGYALNTPMCWRPARSLRNFP
jgi:hypothetical protein